MRTSPLDAVHRALGAKMVPFGGWDMPLEYGSARSTSTSPAATTRSMFDVSHLGTVRVDGRRRLRPAAAHAHQRPRQDRPGPGAVHAPARRHRRLGARRHHRVVAPRQRRRRRLRRDAQRLEHRPRARRDRRHRHHARAVPCSPCRAPRRASALAPVWPEAAAVGRFRVALCAWKGVAVRRRRHRLHRRGRRRDRRARRRSPPSLWRALADAGVRPAGLGARDTLRLEAGLPLHGHELGPGITPLQAGLGWVVGWSTSPSSAARRARGRARTRASPTPRRDRHRGPPPTACRLRGVRRAMNRSGW